MTDKAEADLTALIVGSICLIVWYIAKKYDFADFQRIGLIIFGIGALLIGILDMIFG
jgi:hypothetical protein